MNIILFKIKVFTHDIGKFLMRNHIILNQMNRPIKNGCVNLHWWKKRGGTDNVGDFLSTIIIQWMKNRNQINTEISRDNKTKHLYAIGTIITFGYQNATIWGSGFPEDRIYWWRKVRKLDIRSVRGPLTRQILLKNGYSCPEIYGDPAILMPFIYSPENREKNFKYSVILHHTSEDKYENLLSPVTNDYESFIDRIVQSDIVISSSLHGIILAESYGVPAIMLRTYSQTLLKYQDWYYSTGRTDFPIANSVEEALSITPPPLPDLSHMQSQIIDTFPSDLWK